MYDLWKNKQWSPVKIARKFNIYENYLRYLLKLMDMHGCEIVKHDKNHHYSPAFKLNAINRVLLSHESLPYVSLDLGLPNSGLLSAWIKSFKENGYTVVEKHKGRKQYDRTEREEDTGGTGGRERTLTPAKSETYRRELILKKIGCLSSRKGETGKEEIAQVITELRQELSCSLKFILDTIHANPNLPQISRSDYYYQMKKPDKDAKNEQLMQEIEAIYYMHRKRYGYRRITQTLRQMGCIINHKKVKRLMKKMGLYGITPKAKYKSYKGDFNGTVDNCLIHKVIDEKQHKTYYSRDFQTTGCNEKWTTDITEFHIAAGKVYLSPIMDMHNREIISYNISTRPDFRQIEGMLEQALAKYPDLKGLVFHSDQGWQYQMWSYHKILKEHGIIQSMSRKGNCLDNAPMENFFGRMKNEMFYGHEYEFETIEQLTKEIEEYIHYYNHERIQIKLKGLTPVQYRYQSL